MIELINNSYKHAFKIIKENLLITIEIDKIEKYGFNCVIIYRDNGEGFSAKAKRTDSFGIEIIKGLVNQMNGKVLMHGRNGFYAKIELKL